MTAVNIVLIFISLSLLAGFLALAYFYIQLLKKLTQRERELNKHYLKKAKTEASEIIEEAGKEALDMLDDSHTLSEKDRAMLEAVVRQITEEQTVFLKTSVEKMMSEFQSELLQIKNRNLEALSKESKDLGTAASAQMNEYANLAAKTQANVDKLTQDFQTQLQQIKNYNINTLTNVSKDIEGNTSKQLGEYTKTLEQETVQSQELVNKKIEDEYKKVEAEIVAYKNQKIQQIDLTLNNLLKQMSLEVLGKAINPEDHREIIMKTLEKAKNENFFVS